MQNNKPVAGCGRLQALVMLRNKVLHPLTIPRMSVKFCDKVWSEHLPDSIRERCGIQTAFDQYANDHT